MLRRIRSLGDILIQSLVAGFSISFGMVFLGVALYVMFVNPGLSDWRTLSQLAAIGATGLSGGFYILCRAGRGSSPIMHPPGARLGIVARFVYSKKNYARVFEPIISDMRFEYNEALTNGELWHARWIHLRGSLAFCGAAIASLGVSAVKLVQKIWTAAS
jgi:hypothetical protein